MRTAKVTARGARSSVFFCLIFTNMAAATAMTTTRTPKETPIIKPTGVAASLGTESSAFAAAAIQKQKHHHHNECQAESPSTQRVVKLVEWEYVRVAHQPLLSL